MGSALRLGYLHLNRSVNQWVLIIRCIKQGAHREPHALDGLQQRSTFYLPDGKHATITRGNETRFVVNNSSRWFQMSLLKGCQAGKRL
jgi:hypothetical protein